MYKRQTEAPFVATESEAEYSYSIPAKTSDWGVNGSGVLEYDVTRVASIAVDDGGSGYTSAPTVTLTDSLGTGFGATAEAIMSGNSVSEIRVVNPGRGYTGTVTATLDGGGFSVAATPGTVTTSTVTYTGFKYFSIKAVSYTHLTLPTSDLV